MDAYAEGGSNEPQREQPQEPELQVKCTNVPSAEAMAQAGIFAQLKAKVAGLKVGADLNFLRFNIPLIDTGTPTYGYGIAYIDQGAAIGGELFGYELWLGAERLSTNGGLSWSDWQWYGKVDNIGASRDGLSVGVEVGLFVGGEARLENLEDLVVPPAC